VFFEETLSHARANETIQRSCKSSFFPTVSHLHSEADVQPLQGSGKALERLQATYCGYPSFPIHKPVGFSFKQSMGVTNICIEHY
jgi:hypothetical protein